MAQTTARPSPRTDPYSLAAGWVVLTLIGLSVTVLTLPLGIGAVTGACFALAAGWRRLWWVRVLFLGLIGGFGWLKLGPRPLEGLLDALSDRISAFLDGFGSQNSPFLAFSALAGVMDAQSGLYWPLFALGTCLGGVLALLIAWSRRLTAVPRSGPSHPPTVHGPTPSGGKTTNAEKLDGPALVSPPVPWKALQQATGYRYRVGRWVIFAGVGSPRFRVYTVKGGVNPAFYLVVGTAVHGSLHGNAEIHGNLHGSDIGAWYTVGGTRSHRVIHGSASCYSVGHGTGYPHASGGRATPGPTATGGDATPGHQDQAGDHPSPTSVDPGNPDPHGTGAGPVTPLAHGPHPDRARPTPLWGDAPGARPWTDLLAPARAIASLLAARSLQGGPGLPLTPRHQGTWGPAEPVASVCLWVAPPKTGKTTLLERLIATARSGGGSLLGLPVQPGGAVVLSEEARGRSVLASAGDVPTIPSIPSIDQDASGGAGRDGVSPGAVSRSLAPLAVKEGSATVRGIALLPWHLAQAHWLAQECEHLTGHPVRRLVLDSLFHWVPEAETDTRAAKAAMAGLRAAATFGPGYTVDVLCHSDPETGRLKGPQQTWAQADYRVDLTPAGPKGTRPEDSPARTVHFSGRYVPPESRPQDRPFTLPASGPTTEPDARTQKREHLATRTRRTLTDRVVTFLADAGQEVPATTLAAAFAAPTWDGGPEVPRSTVYRAAADLAAPDDNRLSVTIGRRGQKSYAVTRRPEAFVTPGT